MQEGQIEVGRVGAEDRCPICAPRGEGAGAEPHCSGSAAAGSPPAESTPGAETAPWCGPEPNKWGQLGEAPEEHVADPP